MLCYKRYKFTYLELKKQTVYRGFNLPVHMCDCTCKCKFKGAVCDDVIFVSHSFRSKCNNFSEFVFVFFRALIKCF